MDPEFFMKEALLEARKAYELKEVPVGAVVVVDGEIVARAHNEVERGADATLHAEVLALRKASERLGRWRLNDALLFVTLEPCSMCVGAMILARVPRLYFGAYDQRQGAVGSCFNLAEHTALPHSIEVFPEVMADECAALLKQFFSERRAN